VGIVNVHAVAEVSVAVSTVPAVIARVAVAPTVPLAVMVSVYADTVREPVYEMTPELSIRILSVAPAAMITVSVRAASPTAPPMKVLLLPVVLQKPAHWPAKKLLLPAVLKRPAHWPMNVLKLPVVLQLPA
jgi:hypothetical protein